MSFQPILLPLLAQVILTFAVWLYMYATRIAEIKRKRIDSQELANDTQVRLLLTDSVNPANNLRNLFEMPILFYVAILLTMALLIQDILIVRLAWGYVILRTIHSVVHCTYNRVMHRFITYAISCLFLALIWIRLAAYILMH